MLAMLFLSRPHIPLFTLSRFACSQLKVDIFTSKYHMLGPTRFKRSRAVEKALAGQLTSIQSLLTKLDPLRTQIIKAPLSSSEVHQYVGLYEKLREAVSACQINNEWVYSVISWYNMTPFYRILLDRLLRADLQELSYLVKALHSMRRDQAQMAIHQELLEDTIVDNFYKRLNVNLEVSLLRKMEEVMQSSLVFSKRRYFQKYLQENLEILLKSLNAGDAEQVSDLVWLFEAAIKAMYDDDILIAKMEKAMLTMRVPLAPNDLDRLVIAYERKGRLSPAIYKNYIKPHLLKHQLKDFDDAVKCLKFLVCSQVSDPQFMQQLYSKLSDMDSISKLKPQMAQTLHLYTHYLRIKGVRIFLGKNIQNQLQQLCKNQRKDRQNSINKLLADKQKLNGTYKRMFSYASDCTNAIKKTKMQELTQEQLTKFQEAFAYRLGSLDLKNVKIYKEARFCCINMEYCIHSKGSSQIIDLESECGSYVFASGRLARQIEIRDQLLGHYGVKVNHFNSMRFKGKGRMSEEEYLINRRVASMPPY